MDKTWYSTQNNKNNDVFTICFFFWRVKPENFATIMSLHQNNDVISNQKRTNFYYISVLFPTETMIIQFQITKLFCLFINHSRKIKKWIVISSELWNLIQYLFFYLPNSLNNDNYTCVLPLYRHHRKSQQRRPCLESPRSNKTWTWQDFIK